MSYRNQWIILFAASCLVSVFCYLGNPQGYLFYRDFPKILNRPGKAAPANFKDLNSSCKSMAQYRYNEKRTGATLTDQPKSKVRIVKQIYPLNVDIHGASKSSPTIDETGIYIGSDTGWFWKMDHDGNILWSFYVPGSQNGIHGSAAVDDKKVYIGAYNGFLYALDKTDGSVVWANPVANFIGASPLLAGGALYISAETGQPDGLVAKLDCNTGKTQWVSPWLGGHSHSSPTFDESNDIIFAGANSGRFFALSAETGEILWQKQLAGPVKGTAMINGEAVYIGSWDKNYHSYNTKTGENNWTTYMGGRIQTSLSLVPDSNIGVTNTKVGEIVGIDLSNGNIIWRLVHGDSNHQFSILITPDPDRKGEYLAWSRCKTYKLCTLDAKTGKLLNNIDLPGSFTSVPYAWKDKIYISLDKNQGMVILQ